MLFQQLSELTIIELLATHSSVLNELKRRGVVRTQNNPTGDYAEWLVSNKFGLALEANAATGFDAKDIQGVRYQIKGRRLTPGNTSTQLGVIRNIEKKNFDFLIGVVFDADWQILRAAKIPHEAVSTLANFSEHQNGHIMYLRPTVFDNRNVEDISEVLRR